MISFSFKILLISLILGIPVFYFLPTDEFGVKCGGKSPIPYLLLGVMILVPFVVGIRELGKKKISILGFGILLILLVLASSIIGLTLLYGTRCCPQWKVAIANLNQLATAQKIFYDNHGRFADSQEELIQEGILSTTLKDNFGRELTDKDGVGIEGGDEDPNTWSARAWIEKKSFTWWCKPTQENFWYVCNEKGCSEK